VAQRGRRADWVKNIQANSRVQVKVRTASGVAWRAGTASILDDDDARDRWRRIGQGDLARRLCVSTSAAMGTDPLTVRIDLDPR
jgi:F420H(2)-dependent quinone reductase